MLHLITHLYQNVHIICCLILSANESPLSLPPVLSVCVCTCLSICTVRILQGPVGSMWWFSGSYTLCPAGSSSCASWVTSRPNDPLKALRSGYIWQGNWAFEFIAVPRVCGIFTRGHRTRPKKLCVLSFQIRRGRVVTLLFCIVNFPRQSNEKEASEMSFFPVKRHLCSM